jgi:hypothetical protein
MEEYTKHGKKGLAAVKAGMDRKTGQKYRELGKLPSQLKRPRTWRTREDPFAEAWNELAAMLTDAPELEAKTLFEVMLEKDPTRWQPGQLRTLQRRVRDWRAQHGPEKEVFFAQVHRPGEAMQTDFFNANELEIRISGAAFEHLICHPVLPYSNWEWATVCGSESLMAVRVGVQSALFQLGRVPEWHQTDNSTAATHRPSAEEKKRPFNDEYQRVMDHFGMKPRTIEVGESHQNGDVEALNGAFKRRLLQHLLVRGSRDFESVEAYEAWVQAVATKANALRTKRIAEELAVMKVLAVDRLPEYREEQVLVTGWSTIRVKENTYSVPSRLVGEYVRVHVYDSKLEVLHGGKPQLVVERLKGRNGHSINYRHIIWSLVQKPGAFAQYRYRDDLFPSLVFRKAYDALVAVLPSRKADLEYLRVLHLAASTMESEVEAALERLLAAGELKTVDQVKAQVSPDQAPAVPELAVPEVDLHTYDGLLSEEGAS